MTASRRFRIPRRWLLARRYDRAVAPVHEPVRPELDLIAHARSRGCSLAELAREYEPEHPRSLLAGLLQWRMRVLLEAFLNSYDLGLDARPLREGGGFSGSGADLEACGMLAESLRDSGADETETLLELLLPARRDPCRILAAAEVAGILASFYAGMPALIRAAGAPAREMVADVPASLDAGILARDQAGLAGVPGDLIHFARRELGWIFSGLFAHGSLATLDCVPGFSDCDTFGIVRREVAVSSEALLQARRGLLQVWPLLYRIAPLQHHGVMLITEQDRAYYPQPFFPLVLLEHAAKIFSDPGPLRFEVRRAEFEERMVFGQLVQYFRAHRMTPPESSNPFHSRFYAGMALNLPTMYLQSLGDYGYKKFSFARVAGELSARGRRTLGALERMRLEASCGIPLSAWPDQAPQRCDEAAIQCHILANSKAMPWPELPEPGNAGILDAVFELSEELYGKARGRWRAAGPPHCERGFREPDGFRWVGWPEAKTPEDYRDAFAEASRALREWGIREPLVQFGSVGVHGLSDIDLLLVFREGEDVGRLDEIPRRWAGLSPLAQYVFVHPPPMVVRDDELGLLPDFYPIFEWRAFDENLAKVGEGAFEAAPHQVQRLLCLAEMAVFYFLRDFLWPFLSHAADVRFTLLRLHGLCYSIRVLRDAGIREPRWEAFAGSVQRLRKAWFRLPAERQRSEILKHLGVACRIQLELIGRLAAVLREYLPPEGPPAEGVRVEAVLDNEVFFISGWTPEICAWIAGDSYAAAGRFVAPMPAEFGRLAAFFAERPGALRECLESRFVSRQRECGIEATPEVERRRDLLESRIRVLREAGLHWGALPHWGFDPQCRGGRREPWQAVARRHFFEQTPHDVVTYWKGHEHCSERQRRARALVDDGKWEEAITILADLQRLDALNGEVHYLLAYCLHQLKQELGESLRHYKRALECGFSEFWVRYNQALLLHSQGYSEHALADITRALELVPAHPDALAFLAALRDEAGAAQNRTAAGVNLPESDGSKAGGSTVMDKPIMLLFDGNIHSLRGHNLTYAARVAGSARAAGVRFTVVANSDAGSDAILGLEVLPALKQDYWQELSPGQGQDSCDHLALAADQTADVISKAMCLTGIDAHGVLFFPCANLAEVMAIARVCRVWKGDIPRTVLLFRRDLDEQGRLARVGSRGGILLLRQALADLCAAATPGRVRLYTDTDTLTQEHTEALRKPFSTAPIPVSSVFHSIAREERREGPATILYLGDARTEKGYQRIPPVAERLTDDLKEGRVRLVVQSNMNTPGGETGIAAARDRLAAMPGVLLLESPLTEEEYASWLQQADLALLPYEPDFYVARSSGILAEAIVAGCPVVVPQGTWLSEQLRRFGAGRCFDALDPEALGRAVVESLGDLDELRARALERRAGFAGFHNADRLVRFICGKDVLIRAAMAEMLDDLSGTQPS